MWWWTVVMQYWRWESVMTRLTVNCLQWLLWFQYWYKKWLRESHLRILNSISLMLFLSLTMICQDSSRGILNMRIFFFLWWVYWIYHVLNLSWQNLLWLFWFQYWYNKWLAGSPRWNCGTLPLPLLPFPFYMRAEAPYGILNTGNGVNWGQGLTDSDWVTISQSPVSGDPLVGHGQPANSHQSSRGRAFQFGISPESQRVSTAAKADVSLGWFLHLNSSKRFRRCRGLAAGLH